MTGASSGIGAATARALAAQGAAVALAARRLDRLEDLAGEIRESGGAALAIEADVTEFSAAEAVVQRTVAEYGTLDILVNNAGVMLLGPILDAPVEPGAVATELSSQNRLEILESIKQRFVDVERLQAVDIADAIVYIVTRPRHVAINEILIRSTEQEQ